MNVMDFVKHKQGFQGNINPFKLEKKSLINYTSVDKIVETLCYNT